MKTSLEDISPLKKKLSVEIESQEIDKKINEAYKELGKKAKIPGFRPGKVPRKILERHFGNQVAEDVTRSVINETFPSALDEVKTFPLGTPLLEKGTLKQGQNFKYSAVMEIRPQFEVKNYIGLDVEKERLSVNEDDIQKQLDQIRKANGNMRSITQKRPVQKDDYVVLDYEGFEGGRPLDGIKSPNFLLKVGSHDFHPKFEESLLGLKKGSETEIRVGFEEDYHHSKLAGKSVNFKVKLTDIKEMVLPELNDEFARNLGADFKGIEDLSNKIRETITAQAEKRIDTELKQRLLQEISDSIDFEIPHTLVESELDYAVENIKQNFIRSGSNLEKAGLSEEKLRADFRPSSEKRVKQMLILGQIAEQDKITVDDKNLAEGFKELALTTEQDPEVIRKYYEARNLTGSFREKLLEEKTLNYLVEHAKIHEVEKDAINQNDPNKESN